MLENYAIKVRAVPVSERYVDELACSLLSVTSWLVLSNLGTVGAPPTSMRQQGAATKKKANGLDAWLPRLRRALASGRMPPYK
jgi:hypothetical protein